MTCSVLTYNILPISNVARSRPPKGGNKRKAVSALATPSEAPSAPQTPTFAESLSYLGYARPFKNPAYTKNASRRTKNLKTVLTQERERERLERERRRAEREERMDVDAPAGGTDGTEERKESKEDPEEEEDIPSYASIEAPPSFLPQKRYCDITGLEAPYTDPATGLRYHDKSIYEFIKGLNMSAVKEYLALRGVNPIVK